MQTSTHASSTPLMTLNEFSILLSLSITMMSVIVFIATQII